VCIITAVVSENEARKIFFHTNFSFSFGFGKNSICYLFLGEKKRDMRRKHFVEGDDVNVLMGNQFIHFTPSAICQRFSVV
jgi:hypothetical protein